MATIESMFRNMNRVLAMVEQQRRLIEPVQRWADSIARFQPVFDYGQKILDDIERFRRDSEIIAGCYKDTVRKYLVARGWYVGPSLTGRGIVQLAKGIQAGGHDEAIEKAIADHVRSNAGIIEAAVTTHWPARKTVVADAFEAHRKGLYTLSIPAFLAQADGMAFDILEGFVFTNHKGARIADKVQTLIDAESDDQGLMCSFVGILLEEPGMRMRTEDRDQRRLSGDPVSPLNRHGVMHGIDLDYPTEANSLRAISLLSLLTDVHKFKNRPDDSETPDQPPSSDAT